MEHLESAMEIEGCTRLDFALDISQNLDCYDFVPKALILKSTEESWQRKMEL